MPELQKRTSGWNNIQTIETNGYLCPYCGNKVASNLGWLGGPYASIYVCPLCVHPTYFTEEGKQIPGTAPGEKVANVPLQGRPFPYFRSPPASARSIAKTAAS